MKKAVYALVVVAAAAAAAGWFALRVGGDGPPLAGSVAGYVPKEAPGPAPDITFLDADGSELRLTDFRGEVLIVNFWATWCAPCVAEMPSLDRLAVATEGQDIRVVTIAFGDDTAEDIRAFYERVGVEALPLYRDPTGRSLPAFGAYGLPTTALIDADGNWVGTLTGAAEWDSDEARALIDHYAGDQGAEG